MTADTRRANLMWEAVATAGVVLFPTAGHLWGHFPAVPFFGSVRGVPGIVDSVLSFGLAWATIAMIFGPNRRWSHAAAGAYIVLLAMLIILNQHSLQPWAYEFLLIVFVLATTKPSRAAMLIRLLVISIYLHSGLSKLDASFINTHGQTLAEALANVFGMTTATWSPGVRKGMAAAMPIGELVISLSLLIPRLRTIGLLLSIAMHLVLLLTLGPLGLNHEWGVLIWNVFFIAQNVILFSPWIRSNETETQPAIGSSRFGIADVVVCAAVLLPFLEPWGWYDPWPSWAVYASAPERVHVYLSAKGAEALPARIQPYLGQPRWEDERHPFRIDRWSLESVHQPLYPGSRFSVGVAMALAEEYKLDDIRVEIEDRADRWTGQRETTVLDGIDALRAHANSYRLNASPR